jgi:hypothetical protein
MHDSIMQQLSGYADGELGSGESAAVERHLAGCAECRKALDGIRAIKAWAPTYQGTPPGRDLWQTIESRLGTRPIGSGALKPAWHGRRVTVRVPLLAAAGLVLVVLGAAATRMFFGGEGGAGPDSALVVPASLKHWNDDRERATNTEFDAAISELEATLATSGDELEPGTLAVIRESLATIDTAIAEARRAIAEDSSNAYLNASIAQNMRRKLGILRLAAQAATAKS